MYKIEEGNAIRKKYNNNSVLVELAIREIYNNRVSEVTKDSSILPKAEEFKSRRKCFIFNSELKIKKNYYFLDKFILIIFINLVFFRHNLKEKKF